jgi:hypothetical protein
VPAAAVIPAPIAYTKVVAVKKLVVGSRVVPSGSLRGGTSRRGLAAGLRLVLFVECLARPTDLL